jgi:hypothetical protein
MAVVKGIEFYYLSNNDILCSSSSESLSSNIRT